MTLLEKLLLDVATLGHVPDRVVAGDEGQSAYFFFAGRGHVSIHLDEDGTLVLVNDDPTGAPTAVEISGTDAEKVARFLIERRRLAGARS